MTGRTLLDYYIFKGQQLLDDHYFGSIPSRAFKLYEIRRKNVVRIPVKQDIMKLRQNQFELARF
jgi:glutamine synthetase type III